MDSFAYLFMPNHIFSLSALACIAYSLYQHLCHSTKQITTNTIAIITAAVCLNPYIFDLLRKDWLDTVEQVGWIVFMLETVRNKQSTLPYFLLGVSSTLNPSNFLYFIFKILNMVNIKQKTIIFMMGVALTLSCLYFFSRLSLSHYYDLYFPSSFEPQFNLLWMLYAHMFDRYLHLYQLVFLILQASSAYLISTLRLPHHFQLVLLTYFKVYCTYKCSQLCLIVALLLSAILMHASITAVIGRQSELSKNSEAVKVKTLTLIIVIANIAFLPLDKILLSKYLNDFSLNIGYLFLFFGFPWILNSIYLAEISLTINDLNENEQNRGEKVQQLLAQSK